MIYVASSWRNYLQPTVVEALRSAGHDVYDFKNPKEHPHERDTGFHWSDIDPEWQGWSPQALVNGLDHELARAGFRLDFEAMKSADAFVLVMPCGRSAHLELGWAVGAGARTAILLTDGEPELMYRMVDKLLLTVSEAVDWAGAVTGQLEEGAAA